LHADTHTPHTHQRPPRASWIEALVVFSISAAATRLLSDLAAAWAPLSEYLFTLVAAVFLGLPWLILTRQRRDLEAHALTWTGWPRAALTALLLAALTALPFWAAYHLWRTQVQKQHFDFSLDNYHQLPVELEGAPPPLQIGPDPQVQLWRDGRLLLLRWTAGAPQQKLLIDLHAPNNELALASGNLRELNPTQSPGRLTLSTVSQRRVHTAALRLRGAQPLHIHITANGKPITARALRLGPAALPPDRLGDLDPQTQRLTLTPGLSWIPLLILAQLLLVALPEEWFYRGYLQTTLARAWPQRVRILGPIEIGPANLLTSLLFGLGHFVINLHPARFAVFFPSLLFGWLRDRNGTIASCVLYHAACNLMVEAATHHYI
jgi:hypothetical protein